MWLTSEGGPFGGTAATIPGKIEAEEYDFGSGVGYHDTPPATPER